MYAAHAARSAVHQEIGQYEDDNVGTQALSEGEKAAENVRDISKGRYARKLKRKAKMQGKKNTRTTKATPQEPTAAQNAGDSGISEGGSNWLSRWKQRQEIRKGYYATARSGSTAAQTAGGKKAASGGTAAVQSGVEQVVDKGKSAVSAAVNGLMTAAKKQRSHSGNRGRFFFCSCFSSCPVFSSCSIIFSGTTLGRRADHLHRRGQRYSRRGGGL